ncbi:MAG: hypothetical protein KDB39_04330 [Austwickia sp.]|nr:hypothetical protein [Austwickia sp.]
MTINLAEPTTDTPTTATPSTASPVTSAADATHWVSDVSGSGGLEHRRTDLPTPAPVHVDPLLRQGNAFYVAVHGLVHVLAAMVAWTGLSVGLPLISTTALSPGVLAALLAILGGAFVVAAALLAVGRGWRPVLLAATAVSTLACLATLPESAIGLGVNAAIGVGLLASRPRR